MKATELCDKLCNGLQKYLGTHSDMKQYASAIQDMAAAPVSVRLAWIRGSIAPYAMDLSGYLHCEYKKYDVNPERDVHDKLLRYLEGLIACVA